MSLENKRLLAFADFEIDAGQGLLFRRGEHVPLPPKVFQTLLAFVQSGGRLLTKDELIHVIWPDTFVEEHNLTSNVYALRKALNGGSAERYIQTVARRGYRFVEPVREIIRENDAAPAAEIAAEPSVESPAPPRSRIAPALWAVAVLVVLGTGF